MNRNTITRLAGAALVTGISTLALAGPASALEAPDPEIGGLVDTGGSTATTTDDSNWMEISIGAVAGLALAGAGVAAATQVRHRHAATTS
jgi:hypothetical protein